jgi:hypothetical protein
MRKGRLVTVVATGAFLLSAGPAAAAQVLPVGVWGFNEGNGTVAHDTSLPPHHNNGTLSGGAVWSSGRFAGALSFNGAASAVTVPDDSALDPQQVTVSAWVKASSSPGNFMYVVAKGGNTCSASSYGLYTGANGGLQFYTSSNNGLSYALSPDAGSGLWDGKWHSAIGTFDGKTVRLYIDGREVGSGTPDTAPIAYGLPTSNDLMIGNYPACPSIPEGFTGSIDEVKIFNRPLPANEIKLVVLASNLIPQWVPTDAVL